MFQLPFAARTRHSLFDVAGLLPASLLIGGLLAGCGGSGEDSAAALAAAAGSRAAAVAPAEADGRKTAQLSRAVGKATLIWVPCTKESPFCSFLGTRVVRYGTPTRYFSATYSGGVMCSAAVFGDPAPGEPKSCSYASQSSLPLDAPALAAGASGPLPPVVFNATASARAGDVVSLQGDYFGNSPTVFLESAPTVPLEIVNRVGTGWLAVQIPATAPGALTLRIATADGTSAPVKLNAATPLHLDTTQLVRGGSFRLYGRNLQLAGSTPRILVDGQLASIDFAASDDHLLVATAPAALNAATAGALTVDNGNGSGAATLDRPFEVVATPSAGSTPGSTSGSTSVSTSGSTDPYALGVGWAAGFASIAAHVVDATSDARLARKVVCDDVQDVTPALQSAIDLAAADGGGTVRVPAGRCRLNGGITLRSNVVVEGAGKAATELAYASNYAVYAVGVDLAGLRNLTLTNAGNAGEAPLMKDSTRVVLQNVRIRLATSRQMYLSGNRNFAVSGCDFEQTGSISYQGPYTFNNSAGLVFDGNTTQWVDGAPAFGRIHDSVLRNNRFVRDARQQNAPSGTVHGMTLDFVYRIAVQGNRFEVANGPITNKTRNDGEAILSEGGGAERTENIGTATAAGADTLTDTANTLRTDPFGEGRLPENYGVAIVGGKGAGQTRRLVGYAAPTLKVDRPWDVLPDTTSRYATFVWGMEKSLLQANSFSQQPRGIWLYHAAFRDIDVVDNQIAEGGGIYLRSYQNLATKSFMPMFNIAIARNRITNSTGNWMSYLNSVFVNADAKAFGIATVGVEMRANQIVANRPNASSGWEEYANTEGYMTMMRLESGNPFESSLTPRLLGTLLADNVCSYCDAGVRIGTGAGGTTILNTKLVQSGALADWATTPTPERATDTVSR